MDAVPRHDIGEAAKDGACALLYVHEVEEIKTAFLIVEEKIDIRILTSLIARNRAEQEQALDPPARVASGGRWLRLASWEQGSRARARHFHRAGDGVPAMERLFPRLLDAST